MPLAAPELQPPRSGALDVRPGSSGDVIGVVASFWRMIADKRDRPCSGAWTIGPSDSSLRALPIAGVGWRQRDLRRAALGLLAGRRIARTSAGHVAGRRTVDRPPTRVFGAPSMPGSSSYARAGAARTSTGSSTQRPRCSGRRRRSSRASRRAGLARSAIEVTLLGVRRRRGSIDVLGRPADAGAAALVVEVKIRASPSAERGGRKLDREDRASRREIVSRPASAGGPAAVGAGRRPARDRPIAPAALERPRARPALPADGARASPARSSALRRLGRRPLVPRRASLVGSRRRVPGRLDPACAAPRARVRRERGRTSGRRAARAEAIRTRCREAIPRRSEAERRLTTSGAAAVRRRGPGATGRAAESGAEPGRRPRAERQPTRPGRPLGPTRSRLARRATPRSSSRRRPCRPRSW